MALRVFASAWGNATHWGSLRRLMDGLKFKGFAGLEALSLIWANDADARRDVAQQARDRGLELIVGLYSHWTDYEGTWAAATRRSTSTNCGGRSTPARRWTPPI